MPCRRLLSGLLAALLFAPLAGMARPFTVLVYNVENLFDADGVAAYDDYQPPGYGQTQLNTKLRNIAEIVARIDDGRGPDVILFQEIEVDRTPDREPSATDQLLRALADRGLKGYSVVLGGDQAAERHEDGNLRAIQCVTFTRLPVRATRRFPTRLARNILEVTLEIDGAQVYVFNNHWKSGAGDPEMEKVRLENAAVLRARLDEILRADPHADIIIGGDFNSHYNQNRRYAASMPTTALNGVLRSQGNELALRGAQRDLYNLWFELPEAQRGSDIFRDEWGTLMQIIVSRGLYDLRGVQYVDNSFAVIKVPGMNTSPEGRPIRWTNEGPAGGGFSDHFPLLARFTTTAENRTDQWIALKRPSESDESSARPVRAPRASLDLSTAVRLADVGTADRLRDGSFTGKPIAVDGRLVAGERLAVEVLGETWDVWVPDPALRAELRRRWKAGERIGFVGPLGRYKGRWQFVIEQKEWVSR
jgi:endonuclease/exonuclease/phosphatase family metal-dependent hydrolase